MRASVCVRGGVAARVQKLSVLCVKIFISMGRSSFYRNLDAQNVWSPNNQVRGGHQEAGHGTDRLGHLRQAPGPCPQSPGGNASSA